MDDRGLLELAAKAARIDFHIDHLDGCPKLVSDGLVWNPLVHDGDALRLAVRLGLRVLTESLDGKPTAVSKDGRIHIIEQPTPDACVAVRRAIVRAAASIGKEGE